jgi:hypothetical protein
MERTKTMPTDKDQKALGRKIFASQVKMEIGREKRIEEGSRGAGIISVCAFKVTYAGRQYTTEAAIRDPNVDVESCKEQVLEEIAQTLRGPSQQIYPGHRLTTKQKREVRNRLGYSRVFGEDVEMVIELFD